jgi:hypothetical protein
MSMMDLTVKSLSEAVEQMVPEVYVTIAKNSVVGLSPNQIAELLGVSQEEISNVFADQLYKDVRLLIAAEYAKESVESDFTWDAIEAKALQNLAKRVPHTHDTDQLLRIAAVANKAQRRHRDQGPKILDPSLGGARVPLTLTDRIVKKLGSGGIVVEETRERQVSIADGSAVNPNFNEIDRLLGVSARPSIPEKFSFKTHEPDFGIEDLEYDDS